MSSERKIYLTRRESFSAAHRLHSNFLSDDENRTVFDKCNNPNGHGHNYVLEVTVCGRVDLKTGMTMNITDLKQIISRNVLDLLDHKNLDQDVEYFRQNQLVSTTENLAIFIWEQLANPINQHTGNVHLYEVKIFETDKNIVTYRGD